MAVPEAAPGTSHGFGARATVNSCRSTAARTAGSRAGAIPARCWSSFDDATSRLMQLRFVPSESTESYFVALRGYRNDHGCPVAFYSNHCLHSVRLALVDTGSHSQKAV